MTTSMKTAFRNVALAAATVTLFGGCSYVQIDPAAKDVLVLGTDRVRSCEQLGETKVSVATKIGFIKRGDPAIRTDLERLARNSAAEAGGDTVSALTNINNGKQRYGIYDCVN